MIRTLLTNHVFANLTFLLILIVGTLAYTQLPRQQDPEMNFNWIQIQTMMPGASAEDVEKLVTDILEESIEKLSDVRFASSTSEEGSSSILVRFRDIDDRTFDKRVSDLRREIRNKQRELPTDAEDPLILEITSANGFPTATVVVVGESDGENLRRQARMVKKDLERLRGVDTAATMGLNNPEMQIRFSPLELAMAGTTPTALADTIRTRFRDRSGGTMRAGGETWLLRMEGVTESPETLASWPVVGTAGELPMGRVADVSRTRKKAIVKVRYDGKPAVMISITKQPRENSLELTERIRTYIESRAPMRDVTGVSVLLADDTTHMVKNALAVMENNALVGLFMVMVVAWLFMGWRIALLIGLGIPFTLAGVFLILYAWGWSLNVMVLLGVVISLGMLVDDAVVVVEAIHARINQGADALDAGIQALREVAVPVTTSVLTTMAAFLPLMLLPGILGKFMRVIPVVVTLALAMSLVEAFWMLPSHVGVLGAKGKNPGRIHRMRMRFLSSIRIRYVWMLSKFFRRPYLFLPLSILPLFAAGWIVATERVKVDFFAFDPFPLYYVNITMPAGSSLDRTMGAILDVEKRVRSNLKPGEARTVVGYAGQQFTETKIVVGDRYGQILVSLVPDSAQRRSGKEIIEAMRTMVESTPGPESVSFLTLSGGPPVGKPISVKVRGDDFAKMQPAVEELKRFVATIKGAHDVTDNFAEGRRELVLEPDGDAIRRAGLHPTEVIRLIRLLADGEVVARFQNNGEKVEVRVAAKAEERDSIMDALETPIALPAGGTTTLGRLVNARTQRGMESISHYNFRRTITVEAELDKPIPGDPKTADLPNTEQANAKIKEFWQDARTRHPGVSLDFSGILDDINESMDAIATLFIFGIGLMYMILGTQFRSYWQPLMILLTVPMAFTGVVFGMLITGHPLSLYTLYGVVALSGIAVNASIVLISAANTRARAGMRPMLAVIFAARRRVVPILITTLTTMAGLFSLATGLAGHSLLWGPVATAIVWGLGFSTFLTLFMIPLLFWLFNRKGNVAPGSDKRKEIESGSGLFTKPRKWRLFSRKKTQQHSEHSLSSSSEKSDTDEKGTLVSPETLETAEKPSPL
ncbi:MAG: efflux RND transporter permease subunit [Magnetococcales bacterium]|nr:efflux RND transporter permease subunit [Magnetococcales bacterium]